MLGCFSKLRRPSSINIASAAGDPSAAGEPSTVIFKSFNSLYEPSSFALDPDLISSAIASRRLFPASPGPSNSILDPPAVIISLGSTGFAVPTYTPDPYSDFRRSMEEMVAAIGDSGGGTTIDIAFLRELLLCYLELNRKQAHKYIFCAFADLLVSISGGVEGFRDE